MYRLVGLMYDVKPFKVLMEKLREDSPSRTDMLKADQFGVSLLKR